METKREAIDYSFEDVITVSGFDGETNKEISEERTYKIRFELRYDGSLLAINSWMCDINDQLTESPTAQLIIFGADQLNLLTIVMTTMLEAYGQPNMKNDKNLQKLYRKMAKEAKNTIFKEAT